MHNRDLPRWQHDHAFAQDQKRPGEARTFLVIALTATMMVVEIVFNGRSVSKVVGERPLGLPAGRGPPGLTVPSGTVAGLKQ
jgi:hypothetical protein